MRHKFDGCVFFLIELDFGAAVLMVVFVVVGGGDGGVSVLSLFRVCVCVRVLFNLCPVRFEEIERQIFPLLME